MINLVEKIDKELEEAEDTRDYSVNHPSELGWVFDCMRRLVLLRTEPEIAREANAPKKKFFAERKKHEILMRKDLEGAGCRLLHFDGPLSWPEYNIAFEPDDLIFPEKTTKKPHIIEYKTCEPYGFREIKRMNRWEDFLGSKRPYIRHYPTQTMMYCPALKANGYDINEEVQFILFKEPLSGEKHQVEIFYDDLHIKKVLAAAKKINSYVANGVNEEAEWKEDCRYCEYSERCFDREMIFKQGIPVVTNEEAELKLDRCGEIKKHRDEYDTLMKELKAQFRGDTVVIGDWKIVSTTYPATAYSVPEEIKAQYIGKVPRIRMNIVPLIKAV